MTARFVFPGTLGLCYSKIGFKQNRRRYAVGDGECRRRVIQNARAVIDDALAKTRLPHWLPPAVLLLLGERLNPSELQPLASKNASGCWPAALTVLLRGL